MQLCQLDMLGVFIHLGIGEHLVETATLRSLNMSECGIGMHHGSVMLTVESICCIQPQCLKVKRESPSMQQALSSWRPCSSFTTLICDHRHHYSFLICMLCAISPLNEHMRMRQVKPPFVCLQQMLTYSSCCVQRHVPSVPAFHLPLLPIPNKSMHFEYVDTSHRVQP